MVASLMHIIEEEAHRHAVERITRVRLAVGLFTVVEPMALRACFELFAEGSVAEGAELVVELVPASGLCLRCGARFEMRTVRCRCPECGSDELDGSGGREFTVTGLEGC